jgi:hypothetical protein
LEASLAKKAANAMLAAEMKCLEARYFIRAVGLLQRHEKGLSGIR